MNCSNSLALQTFTTASSKVSASWQLLSPLCLKKTCKKLIWNFTAEEAFAHLKQAFTTYSQTPWAFQSIWSGSRCLWSVCGGHLATATQRQAQVAPHWLLFSQSKHQTHWNCNMRMRAASYQTGLGGMAPFSGWKEPHTPLLFTQTIRIPQNSVKTQPSTV